MEQRFGAMERMNTLLKRSSGNVVEEEREKYHSVVFDVANKNHIGGKELEKGFIPYADVDLIALRRGDILAASPLYRLGTKTTPVGMTSRCYNQLENPYLYPRNHTAKALFETLYIDNKELGR